MRLNTDWLVQEPIDLEHKQYVVLAYISKVNKDFDEMKLYPSFQELTLHLASLNRFLDKGEYITLSREPEEIDDEILIEDLIYNKVKSKSREVIDEIIDIANYSKDKITDLFLIGKSIWSILYDSVTIKVVYNSDKIMTEKPGDGFFYMVYDDKLLIYQYNLRKIKDTTAENKCDIIKIYEGDVIDVTNTEELISIIKQNHNLPERKKINLTPYQRIDDMLPIFRIKYEQKFPLEGAILSIAKRKVMNYIFQTIKISELKND